MEDKLKSWLQGTVNGPISQRLKYKNSLCGCKTCTIPVFCLVQIDRICNCDLIFVFLTAYLLFITRESPMGSRQD